MTSTLVEKIIHIVAQFYPESLDISDGRYENSKQWQRQEALRADAKQHENRVREVSEFLSALLPEERIDDDSCPSLYPAYHFRILVVPEIQWPRQDKQDWDVELCRKSGNVVWIDLFLSYLAKYFAGNVTELQAERNDVSVRRLPVEGHAVAGPDWTRIRAAFEGAGWTFLTSPTITTVLPAYATDTGGLGHRTVFELLFSDTAPGPDRWDGVWQPVEPLPVDETVPLGAAKNPLEVPIGQLVRQATLRAEIGSLPAHPESEPSDRPKKPN
jgi:hypothetical protein